MRRWHGIVAAGAVSLWACGTPQGGDAEGPVAPAEPTEPPAVPVAENPPASPTPAAPTPAADLVPPPPAPVPASSFADAVNAFSTDTWARLRTRPGNLAVSPASIWIALAMTQQGARGATADEMARTMRMPADFAAARAAARRQLQAWNAAGRGELTLRIVNRLFGEKTVRFEPEYLRATRETWGAPLEPTDFRAAAEAARVRINDWVARETQTRIRDLLPPASIDADTRLVLTNAVYFLGKWAQPFEHFATRDQSFFVARGQGVPVPTMHQTTQLSYGEAEGVQVLEMPYRGGSFSMTVVLPRAIDGLFAVEARMDAATVAAWVSTLRPQRVQVSFPKFTIDPAGSLALREMLEPMGMRLAFDRRAADFTAIANPADPNDRLFVGEVFHKAFVKVDEEGTEAAAATAVVMPRGAGAPAPAPEFRADHPFLFFLRDTSTGVILFVGRVQDPTGGR